MIGEVLLLKSILNRIINSTIIEMAKDTCIVVNEDLRGQIIDSLYSDKDDWNDKTKIQSATALLNAYKDAQEKFNGWENVTLEDIIKFKSDLDSTAVCFTEKGQTVRSFRVKNGKSDDNDAVCVVKIYEDGTIRRIGRGNPYFRYESDMNKLYVDLKNTNEDGVIKGRYRIIKKDGEDFAVRVRTIDRKDMTVSRYGYDENGNIAEGTPGDKMQIIEWFNIDQKSMGERDRAEIVMNADGTISAEGSDFMSELYDMYMTNRTDTVSSVGQLKAKLVLGEKGIDELALTDKRRKAISDINSYKVDLKSSTVNNFDDCVDWMSHRFLDYIEDKRREMRERYESLMKREKDDYTKYILQKKIDELESNITVVRALGGSFNILDKIREELREDVRITLNDGRTVNLSEMSEDDMSKAVSFDGGRHVMWDLGKACNAISVKTGKPILSKSLKQIIKSGNTEGIKKALSKLQKNLRFRQMVAGEIDDNSNGTYFSVVLENSLQQIKETTGLVLNLEKLRQEEDEELKDDFKERQEEALQDALERLGSYESWQNEEREVSSFESLSASIRRKFASYCVSKMDKSKKDGQRKLSGIIGSHQHISARQVYIKFMDAMEGVMEPIEMIDRVKELAMHDPSFRGLRDDLIASYEACKKDEYSDECQLVGELWHNFRMDDIEMNMVDPETGKTIGLTYRSAVNEAIAAEIQSAISSRLMLDGSYDNRIWNGNGERNTDYVYKSEFFRGANDGKYLKFDNNIDGCAHAYAKLTDDSRRNAKSVVDENDYPEPFTEEQAEAIAEDLKAYGITVMPQMILSYYNFDREVTMEEEAQGKNEEWWLKQYGFRRAQFIADCRLLMDKVNEALDETGGDLYASTKNRPKPPIDFISASIQSIRPLRHDNKESFYSKKNKPTYTHRIPCEIVRISKLLSGKCGAENGLKFLITERLMKVESTMTAEEFEYGKGRKEWEKHIKEGQYAIKLGDTVYIGYLNLAYFPTYNGKLETVRNGMETHLGIAMQKNGRLILDILKPEEANKRDNKYSIELADGSTKSARLDGTTESDSDDSPFTNNLVQQCLNNLVGSYSHGRQIKEFDVMNHNACLYYGDKAYGEWSETEAAEVVNAMLNADVEHNVRLVAPICADAKACDTFSIRNRDLKNCKKSYIDIIKKELLRFDIQESRKERFDELRNMNEPENGKFVEFDNESKFMKFQYLPCLNNFKISIDLGMTTKEIPFIDAIQTLRKNKGANLEYLQDQYTYEGLLEDAYYYVLAHNNVANARRFQKDGLLEELDAPSRIVYSKDFTSVGEVGDNTSKLIKNEYSSDDFKNAVEEDLGGYILVSDDITKDEDRDKEIERKAGELVDSINELNYKNGSMTAEEAMHIAIDLCRKHDIDTNDVDAIKKVCSLLSDKIMEKDRKILSCAFKNMEKEVLFETATADLIQLTSGDIAHAKNYIDFQKRNKQQHAPFRRLFTESFYGRKVRRAMILNDKKTFSNSKEAIRNYIESDKCSNLTSVEKSAVLSALDEVEVTDGMSFMSLSAMRAVMDMSGQWNKKLDDSLKRIKDGTWNFADLTTMMQSIKPYYGGSRLEYDANGNVIQTFDQFKDQNAAIFASLTMIPNVISSSPVLRGIDRFMEDNCIDALNFKSTYKFGTKSIIDMSAVYDADNERLLSENPDDEDEKARIEELTVQHLVKATGLNNMRRRDKNDKPIDYTAKEMREKPMTDDFKSESIVELSYNSFGIQQVTPEHLIDHTQLIGTQIRKLIKGDMPDDAVIYMANGDKISGAEWKRRFNSANAANIMESFLKFAKRFDSVDDLSKTLQDKMRGDDKYGEDMMRALDVTTDRDGVRRLNLELIDPSMLTNLESLINSIIRKGVTRQKIKGGSAVQVSCFGLEELSVVFEADIEGQKVEYTGTKQLIGFLREHATDILGMTDTDNTIGQVDERATKYIKRLMNGEIENSSIRVKHMECYMPVYDTQLLNYLYQTQGAKDVFDIESIPEELLQAIGYRIPTEDKYSMAPLKIKGFLPQTAGGAIMLPKDITMLSGSDFDIDKMYLMFKSFKIEELDAPDTALLAKRFYDDAKKGHIPQGVSGNVINYFRRIFDAINKDDNRISKEQFYTQLIFGNKTEVVGNIEKLAASLGLNPKMTNAFIDSLRDYYRKHEWGFNHKPVYSRYDTSKDASQNTKEQRDNEIIELCFASLTSPHSMQQFLDAGNFDELKRLRRMCDLLSKGGLIYTEQETFTGIDGKEYECTEVDHKTPEDGKGKRHYVPRELMQYVTLDFATKLMKENGIEDDVNPLSISTYTYFYAQNMGGKGTTGIWASSSAGHSVMQEWNVEGTPINFCGIKNYNGKSVKRIDDILAIPDPITGAVKKISKNTGTPIGASTDTAKDPTLTGCNLTPFTANAYNGLIRCGFPIHVGVAMCAQPIVKVASNVYGLLKAIKPYTTNEKAVEKLMELLKKKLEKREGGADALSNLNAFIKEVNDKKGISFGKDFGDYAKVIANIGTASSIDDLVDMAIEKFDDLKMQIEILDFFMRMSTLGGTISKATAALKTDGGIEANLADVIVKNKRSQYINGLKSVGEGAGRSLAASKIGKSTRPNRLMDKILGDSTSTIVLSPNWEKNFGRRHRERKANGGFGDWIEDSCYIGGTKDEVMDFIAEYNSNNMHKYKYSESDVYDLSDKKQKLALLTRLVMTSPDPIVTALYYGGYRLANIVYDKYTPFMDGTARRIRNCFGKWMGFNLKDENSINLYHRSYLNYITADEDTLGFKRGWLMSDNIKITDDDISDMEKAKKLVKDEKGDYINFDAEADKWIAKNVILKDDIDFEIDKDGTVYLKIQDELKPMSEFEESHIKDLDSMAKEYSSKSSYNELSKDDKANVLNDVKEGLERLVKKLDDVGMTYKEFCESFELDTNDPLNNCSGLEYLWRKCVQSDWWRDNNFDESLLFKNMRFTTSRDKFYPSSQKFLILSINQGEITPEMKAMMKRDWLALFNCISRDKDGTINGDARKLALAIYAHLLARNGAAYVDGYGTIVPFEIKQALGKDPHDDRKGMVSRLRDAVNKKLFLHNDGSMDYGKVIEYAYQFFRNNMSSGEIYNLGYTIRGKNVFFGKEVKKREGFNGQETKILIPVNSYDLNIENLPDKTTQPTAKKEDIEVEEGDSDDEITDATLDAGVNGKAAWKIYEDKNFIGVGFRPFVRTIDERESGKPVKNVYAVDPEILERFPNCIIPAAEVSQIKKINYKRLSKLGHKKRLKEFQIGGGPFMESHMEEGADPKNLFASMNDESQGLSGLIGSIAEDGEGLAGGSDKDLEAKLLSEMQEAGSTPMMSDKSLEDFLNSPENMGSDDAIETSETCE